VRGKVLDVGLVVGPQLLDLVQHGCRRLLLCGPRAVQVEALRRELLEAADGEGMDPEVRGALEGLEVVGVPELVTSTREMRDAIWPRLRGARW
jgi:hypothetical protein